jgi:hypothetical protein
MLKQLIQEKAERDLNKEFNASLLTVQNQVEKLHALLLAFQNTNHKPSYSQLSQLRLARGSFGELHDEFSKIGN